MKKIILYVLLAVLAVAAMIIGYEVLHAFATAERGHEAIGGEIAVFFIPYIVYMFRRNIKDTKECFKDK